LTRPDYRPTLCLTSPFDQGGPLSCNEFIDALALTSAVDQKTITVGVTNDLIRGDIYY